MDKENELRGQVKGLGMSIFFVQDLWAEEAAKFLIAAVICDKILQI